MKGRFAVAQMEGSLDTPGVCQRAGDVIKRAREEYQADLILFPETFMGWVAPGVRRKERIEMAETLSGPFVQSMQSFAKEYRMWVIFGMRESAGEKNYNTTVVLDAQGNLVTHYHKTHLYDAFLGRESDEFLPGDSLFQPIETPFGCLGMFVCYEARFPEVARSQALNGAQILLMPTAWVKGKRKQEQLTILSCARALENTAYLLVSNLCKGNCTGGSMIIDPLGEILCQAGEEEELLCIEIDTDQVKKIRETVPSLKNRREELYQK